MKPKLKLEVLESKLKSKFCQLTNYSSAFNGTEWCDEIDIISIGFIGYYVSISIHDEVSNKLKIFYLPDEATEQSINLESLFKCEGPYRFKICLVHREQLKDVCWYSLWFCHKAQMSRPTLNNIFIPQAEGCMQVLCYDYNDVLCSNKFGNEYCEQLMLNFFKPEDEIAYNQQIPSHSLFYDHYTFLLTAIFVVIPYTNLLSVHSLFYNPFLSTNFEGLGGATKMFAPTVTTTESAVYI